MDWLDDEVTRNLPQNAPILGILHTITGTSSDYRGFMGFAAKRGWRSCVLNRRGHSGMTLRVIPHFSIMGNVDDTKMMVDQIKQHFPNNFVGLVGLSAGSGQVGSYIGQEGDKVKVNAAASIGPAWDISISCKYLQQKFPIFDKFITKKVKEHFLAPSRNQPALLSMSEVVNKSWTARNLEEWMDFAAPLAGCENLEHFYEENNPMRFCQGNKIPCLVLNALDDPICPKECIRYDLICQWMNYILKTTERGSHVAYNEGWFGQGNYMYRLTLDFFEAVMEESIT